MLHYYPSLIPHITLEFHDRRFLVVITVVIVGAPLTPEAKKIVKI